MGTGSVRPSLHLAEDWSASPGSPLTWTMMPPPGHCGASAIGQAHDSLDVLVKKQCSRGAIGHLEGVYLQGVSAGGAGASWAGPGAPLNLIKAIYDKSTANIILNEKNLKVFSLRSGTSKDAPFHHCYLT